MRKRLPITTLIAAVALTYGLYPYVALSQLESAVRQGDPVSLAQLIDWSAVREGIKEDICDLVMDHPAQGTAQDVLPPFGASFVRGVAGTAVDRTITAETLVAATRNTPAADSGLYDGTQVSWAFFTGPGSFRVDVMTPGVTEPIHVDMELRGFKWLVRRVSLPPALLESSHLHT
jgi:hypothetical protein